MDVDMDTVGPVGFDPRCTLWQSRYVENPKPRDNTVDAMEIDRPSYNQGEGQSPPRKRPHMDIAPGDPGFGRANSHFRNAALPPAPNAPVMFNIPDAPPTYDAPFEPQRYDATRAFNAATIQQDVQMQDVSMNSEPDMGEEADMEGEVRPRKVAMGGVKREMRRRRGNAASAGTVQKMQRTPIVEEDDDDEDADNSLLRSLGIDITPKLARQASQFVRQLFIPYPYPVPTPTPSFSYPTPATPAPTPAPDRSAIFYGWVQVSINILFLIILALSALTVLWLFIGDINSAITDRDDQYKLKSNQCIDSYTLNRCGTQGMSPAAAGACMEWEACMKKDVRSLGRTKVLAQVVGDVLDTFVQTVGWKTISVSLAVLLILVIGANFKLFQARSKHTTYAPQPHPHPEVQYQPPPHQPIYLTTPMHASMYGHMHTPGGQGQGQGYEVQHPDDDGPAGIRPQLLNFSGYK